MPYQLVHDTISRDVVQALETLLGYARSGDLTGLAFGATFKRMRYITNVAGVCAKNPTFTRGLLGALDDELAALIHNRDPEETR
jgi:hypothetical protein